MRGIKKYLGRIPAALALAVAMLWLAASCSTTKKLGEGEMLYNGMSIKIEGPEGEKLPPEMKSDLTKAVNVKPNNPWPFISPYKRSPLPIGLWVYNNMSDSAKGLKKWIYNKLVAQPVLLSDIHPEQRINMLDQVLDNNGYFRGRATYEVKEQKNKIRRKLRLPFL